jgi:hypothetical protein
VPRVHLPIQHGERQGRVHPLPHRVSYYYIRAGYSLFTSPGT